MGVSDASGETRSVAPRRRIAVPTSLPSGRAVLGGLLVAVAALGTYVLATRHDGPADTAYAVARHDLAPGQVVGLADVELVALDLPTAQAQGTFAALQPLIGAAVLGPVQSGAVVTAASLELDGGATSAEGGSASPANGGSRELAVSVPVANAVDGALRPGDRVDVVATDADASYVLAERVVVVSSGSSGSGSTLGSGEVRVTLTLPDATTALAVAHGAAAAKLTLLRSTRAADRLPATYHLPTTAGAERGDVAPLRYTVLGLAQPRAAWFGDLGRWATSGTVPAEFVRCVSAEEVRARLASARPYSALLVDGRAPGLDRDLVDVARAARCATFAVAEATFERDSESLGVDAVLASPLDRATLLDTLERHASRLAHVVALPGPALADRQPWRGRLVALTGGGGTGVSVLAMALAQALGDDARNAGNVLLADLALDADQAMLHASPDVVPGVSELVDAHRAGRPDAAAVRATAFEVASRGYDLLLGLRRRRDWAALRPRAVEATLTSLLHTYRHVVADVDPDVDGEEACGSIEVEERNVLARATLGLADAVVVVGAADVKGLHRLVRIIADLVEYGVSAERLVPVLNRAPRSPRARADLASALDELAGGFLPPTLLAGPVAVARQRGLDEALLDGVRLPASFGRPLLGAVQAVLSRTPRSGADRGALAARPLAPGTLGAFAPQASEHQWDPGAEGPARDGRAAS